MGVTCTAPIAKSPLKSYNGAWMAERPENYADQEAAATANLAIHTKKGLGYQIGD